MCQHEKKCRPINKQVDTFSNKIVYQGRYAVLRSAVVLREAMKSISHTKAFEMALPIAELFPLFSPEGEKYWVPG